MNLIAQGVQAVGTLTVGGSGGTSDIENLYPARSNVPFTNLAISVIPVQDNSPYKVSVYHLGELLETHTYPEDGITLCYMTYPNMIFPANAGTNAISKFYDPDRFNAPGVSIRVEVENLGAAQRTFQVYATFVEFEGARFDKVLQEE